MKIEVNEFHEDETFPTQLPRHLGETDLLSSWVIRLDKTTFETGQE
jgi:hypothetical protein